MTNQTNNDAWEKISQSRRDSFNELNTLTYMLSHLGKPEVCLGQRDPRVEKIRQSILVNLNTLYPSIEQTPKALSAAPDEPIHEAFHVNIVNEDERNVHEDVEKAYQPLSAHLSYQEMMGKVMVGSKAAREGWDNKINQEYITFQTGVEHSAHKTIGGFAKFYISVQSDNYKKVEHTYKPTKEDLEATDWYII